MVFVYILKCSDATFYTGITKNLQVRFQAHLKGRVSYTKYRRPVCLLHTEKCTDRKAAAKKERKIKNMGAKKYLIKLKGAMWDRLEMY